MDEEFYQLAENLKREHNYTKRERTLIQNLYLDLLKSYENVYRDWWMLQAQRETLLHYIQCSVDEGSNQTVRFFELDNVAFVRAFTVVQYDESTYVALMKLLRTSPEFTVRLLLHAQQSSEILLQNLCFILYTSVFGSCLSPEDDTTLVAILRQLISLQMAPSPTPGKLLVTSNCAFTRLLRVYVDNMQSAKKFLTAVLYQPIVQLLMQDDWYFDISPNNLLERFSPNVREARFGQPGTDEYKRKISKYRAEIVRCLVSLAKTFINSLHQNLHLFPPTYLHLLGFLAQEVGRVNHLDEAGIRQLCTKFVFESFICPAIVDPESCGVTSDFAISGIVRHNLMEVVKVIQTLVYSQSNGEVPSPQDLFSQFKTDCLSSVMTALMNAARNLLSTNRELVLPDYPDGSDASHVSRSIALITPTGLSTLVSSFRSLLHDDTSNFENRQSLINLLSTLPTAVSSSTAGHASSHPNQQDSHRPYSTLASSQTVASPSRFRRLLQRNSVRSPSLGQSISSNEDCNELLNPEVTVEHTPLLIGPQEDVLVFCLELNTDCPGMQTEHKVLERENQAKASYSRQQTSHVLMKCDDVTQTTSKSSNHTPNVKSLVVTSGLQSSSSSTGGSSISCAGPSSSAPGGQQKGVPGSTSIPVTTVIGQSTATVGVGISTTGAVRSFGPVRLTTADTAWKRTRFSNDQESSGTTIDNPETVSEAAASEIASTHSAPSVDLESQEDADALSDMPNSANVSDRGTPSIISGGRESPLSGADLPVTIVPKNDVTDKFGKFDIPPSRPEIEDRSTVSDTWSTDVLASDSETTEAADSQQRLVEIVEEGTAAQPQQFGAGRGVRSAARWMMTQPQGSSSLLGATLPGASGGQLGGAGSSGSTTGVNETASEDHWSVDVHCDQEDKTSERLEDFDPDDLEEEEDDRSSSIQGQRGSQRSGQSRGPMSECSGPAGMDEVDQLSDEDDLEESGPVAEELDGAGSVGDISGDASNMNTRFEERGSRGKIEKPSAKNRQPAFLPSTSTSVDSVLPSPPSFCSTNGAFTVIAEGDGVSRYDGGGGPSSTSVGLFGPRRRSSGDGGGPVPMDKPKRGSILDRFTLSKGKGRHKKTPDRDSVDSTVSSNRLSPRNSDVGDPVLMDGPSANANLLDPSTRVNTASPQSETLEDMMNRYKSQASEQSDTLPTSDPHPHRSNNPSPPPLFYDRDNVDSCPAWQDAKRKLRLVLSSLHISRSFSCDAAGVVGLLTGEQSGGDNQLARILSGHLADSINLQDYNLRTQIQETLRVVRLFDESSLSRLLRSMSDDWRSRRAYLAYLIRTKEDLCSEKQNADELQRRCARNRSIASRHMISRCIRELLDKETLKFAHFAAQFERAAASSTFGKSSQGDLTPAEEKKQLVRDLLNYMMRLLRDMPFYKAAQSDQASEANRYLERVVMSQIYQSTMSLNDMLAEKERDELYLRELESIAAEVTLSELHIPSKYFCISPFESAQEELKLINCYKTPGDKVECVKRVNDNIIHMLKMANSNLVPSADDLLPVLIYVIIQANPPRLMSNVSYVDIFYGDRLDGELQYVWCQFSAAVREVQGIISTRALKGYKH